MAKSSLRVVSLMLAVFLLAGLAVIAPPMHAEAADEYKTRDAFFSLSDSSVNRMTSEHFQIIWGNEDESGQVNEAFVQGNLTNLENIWDFYVNVLGMKEPNTSVTSGSSTKYKTNFYISNTGLGDVVMDDWAYMSVDSGGFGYMCLMPGAMRVDEPSWVLPHELAHVFTYHQGGNEPYGYYEAIANWFRDQYLGSTYYAYGGNVYGPTSDFFKPYLVNHDYYFPHIYNWYDAWPILLYISENPDNINGLGMDLIHDILENKANGSTIFAIIDELSDVSVKDILGYMTRRMVTLDFSRQQFYQMRRAEQMTSSEIAGMYTTLNSNSDGYLHSPSGEAPMQGGFNIVKLNADLSKSSLNVEFVGTSSASGADYRASIVTVTNSGDTRYSSLFNSGTGSIALRGDETEAYLVVCATPNTMEALTTYEESAVGTRYTYKIRVVENSSHTHSYSSSVTTAATCTTAGVRTFTCSCGSTYTETIAALGHSYSGNTCTRCGATQGSSGAVTTGSYVHNFTESDKTSSFYTISGNTTTSRGDVSYNGMTLSKGLKMESSTSISFTAPADGTLTLVFGGSDTAASDQFKLDGTKTAINSSFIYTGSISAGSHTITKGDTMTLYYMVYTPAGGSSGGDVHTHSYSSSVTTAATCETAGVRTYSCSCGDSYTEAIAALGHNYSSAVTAPTCTAQGYTTYTCVTCGSSYVDSYVNANGHSYANGACTVCGAADPDYSAEWEDTWTTEYAGWANLSGNGTVTFRVSGTAQADTWGFIDNVRLWREENGNYEEIEMVNGYFEDGTNGWTLNGMTTSQDTTAKNNKTNRLVLWISSDRDVAVSASNTVSVGYGNYYFTYDIIGNSTLTVEAVAAESHSHSYSSKVTAPTCTAQGYTTYTCSCGDSYVADYVAAKGHSYTSSLKAPTCTAEGLRTYTCSTCGHSYTETVAALGHSYSNGACTVCGAADPNYQAPDENIKNGLAKGDDGNYYYYIDNEVQWDYTGLIANSAGNWYILNGQAQLSYDGLITFEGTKYLIKAGHVDTAFTGITKQEGVYYYFGQGVNDLEFEGLVYCNGMKAYVQDGEVNFNKTGIVEDEGKLVYVKYGIWRNTFKGLARTDDGKWIYMANGTFDATYTGVAKLNANWVYVENGYVSSTFSGTVTVNGVDYTVKYGVVQF